VVSTQGSSITDTKFVSDSKISPSHFVHTLPNVRTIVFSLLTGWEGEMYCLSKGQESLVNFLGQLPNQDHQKKTLVINMNKSYDLYHCDFYKVSASLASPGYEFIQKDNGQTKRDDFNFRNALKTESEILISSKFSLRKVN
ncbi:MAG: hypothetical protein K2Q18_10675, partial [Bdellovibrionales bacterium]|nr:hypothetical protein [Bdellovibrionales bacterium]